MITRIKLILIFAALLFCCNSIYAQTNSLSKRDIAKIKNMAAKESCSENQNKLFLVEGKFVLWIRKGNCPDNSYSYQLYGKGVKVLCFIYDTIAGPEKKCSPEYEKLFDKLIANIDKENFGLVAKPKLLFDGNR